MSNVEKTNKNVKTKKETEEYDFFKMGRKVAEDAYLKCDTISSKLENDFGEAAKLKFQYGFFQQMNNHSSKIFEEAITKTTTVEKKTSKVK